MTGKVEAVYQGRIGLTSRSSVHVTSDAGGTFSATIYASVNVTKNPELKAKLEAGTLNDVTCPLTQKTYTLAVPIVFHDEKARVFGLLLPDSLRHQEYEHRRRILEAIEGDSEDAPGYVRNFATAFSIEALNAAKADTSAKLPSPKIPPPQAPQELETSKELARSRAAIEAERKELEVERAQLDDVRVRFDREREQLDETLAALTADREALESEQKILETERRRIAAQELNLEQQKLRQDSVGEDVPEEATQVVTDDQFIVVPEEDLVIDDADIADSAPDHIEVKALTSGVPKMFSELASGKADRALKIIDNMVVASAKLDREAIEALFKSDPDVLVQLHMVDNYPVVGLVLAHYDDGKADANVGWALDFADDAHRVILDHLQKHFVVRFGLYDSKGTLLRAVECEAPLRDNVEWIRNQAAAKFDAAKPKGSFSKAKKTYLDKDFERIGSMKHNFEQNSFSDLVNPSDVRLAAGIVGFWSTPQKLEYLLGNRCFPYVHFRGIQERVTHAAVEYGICIAEPLRNIGVELGLAKDESSLVELLTANFAEVCIAIRANDLGPGDQWDNWDALLGLGEELGIPPDPDVIELAEISLKRAQELAELEEMGDAAFGEPSEAEEDAVVIDRTLIVSKQSDTTGVTYFLPQDAVLDSFDNLAEMSRPDLELLLKDPNGRLEASQMLLDRFGGAAMTVVMKGSEEMNAPEVAALAKFVETKASGLEGELVRTVESGGPSATFIAAHALTSMRSTTAIPSLIEALRDPKRNGNSERMVRTLSEYGDKLLPALIRVIKRGERNDRPLINLLAQMEDYSEGTLSKLSKDRSKKLREAARKARELRD